MGRTKALDPVGKVTPGFTEKTEGEVFAYELPVPQPPLD